MANQLDPAAAQRYRGTEERLWRHHGAPDIHERIVPLPHAGRSVRVIEAGTGEPVLFVHGGPNAGSAWAPLAARLTGRRALVVDRPGCGLSDPLPSVRDANIRAEMTGMQAAVIEELAGGGPVDIVASSFGGACALWLAVDRPGLVRSIVIEGVPAIQGMRPALNLRLLAAGPLGRFIASRRATRGTIRWTFRQLGHRRLVGDGWPEGHDLEWSLSLMNDTTTMRNDTALVQRVARWRGFRDGSLFPPDELAQVGVPVLWLWGEEDPFGDTGMGRQWAAATPHSRFELLPGQGHLPWLDDPDGHARMVESFLAAPHHDVPLAAAALAGASNAPDHMAGTASPRN
jgi:pimeloyl-ACP methyl ester carboxylesterase